MARIKGNSKKNTLKGSNRSDSLQGFGGDDKMTGANGNDRLDGGTGKDVLLGGKGNDTYIVDHRSDRAKELSRQGIDTVRASVSFKLGDHVEHLIFTGKQLATGTGNRLNNYISGNVRNNRLLGLAGNDRLIGGSGNDTLDGGTGTDTLDGGKGNDVYVVDNSKDRVIEKMSQGTDTVRSSINYTLTSHVEKLTLTGSQNLDGRGNSLVNTITGNSGNNVLDGKAGADTLIGGAGDDTYLVDSAADITRELANGGIDRVRTALADYTLAEHIEYLEFTGTQNSNGTGNSAANTIIGNVGNNILDGAGGIDELIGGLGNDTYIVNEAGDLVVEAVGEGVDLVKSTLTDYTLTEQVENLLLIGNAVTGTGNSLANTITGNAANNILDGGDGDDSLLGGLGNDKLTGGLGTDTLTGGAGIDTFALVGMGQDIIADFNSSEDIIALGQTAFGLLGQVGSVLSANKLTVVASDALASQGASGILVGLTPEATRLIYSTESGKLFYDANGTEVLGTANGLGTSGGLIATLDKTLGAAPTLSSVNFVIDSII